jgi:multidrug efflux pump subunit AcrB
MESMKIKGPNNQEYPLIELANYTIKRGVININHFNGKREIRIEGDLVDPYESLPPIIEKIEKEVLPPILAKYPNISYTMEGQNRRREKELSSMLKVYPIFFGIMILLIVFAFRSFYQASLILMLIPIGIACAVIGHWFHSVPVSMLSLNGMIALTGIIINDAVVMLDKYNRNLKEGMRYVDAAREAGVARFRAIMLTSITTVAGLYPIILEKSFQAQFLIPMGISVAYGVLFGTIFILFFFPVLILVSNDVKVYVNWFFRSLFAVFTDKEPVKPTHEEVEPAVKELKNEAEVI